MADDTKLVIRAAMLKLLDQKPLKQITVRDIVSECGINRNTFYYHYRDIPALMETIIQEQADQLISQFPTVATVEDCLNTIVSFALAHKRPVLHIYSAVNRDLYEPFQWQICEYAATCYLNEVLGSRQISETDRQFIIEYFKCVSFGMISDWLAYGMREDVLDFIHRICILKSGEMEQIIERCQILNS